MSMIDDIRRDREIGTQGPYCKTSDHEWSLDTGDENAYFVIAGKGVPFAVVAVETAFGDDDRNEADMRRVCRLDKMEAALLAAEEMSHFAEIAIIEAFERSKHIEGAADTFKSRRASIFSYRAATKGGDA